MSLTLIVDWRQCSISSVPGSSVNRANPDWDTSLIVMALLRVCRNSCTVVDPSKLTTYGKVEIT